MKKQATLLLLSLVITLLTHLTAQTNGRFDVRLVVNSTDCTNEFLYVDVEVKASSTPNVFYMGDQNYKFLYNREAINNPRILTELGFSNTLGQPYNPHSTGASIDPGTGPIGLVILNISWNSGTNGVEVPSGTWSPVSRLAFDIVDLTHTLCLDLVWQDQSNAIHFTNITEVEPTPPPGSSQTLPFSTSVDVAEGAYGNATPCLDGLCNGSFPVEWVEFKGEHIGEDVQLDWTTASEANNAFFEIQRSGDGLFFENVGRVKGSGTTSANASYSYTDSEVYRLGNRALYYRLRQVDVDGAYQFSDIIEVQVDFQADILVDVFPNPASEFVFIEYNTYVTGGLTLEMFNETGQKVFARAYLDSKGTIQLPLKSYAKGIYTLRTFTETASRTVKFVIK